jgi:hypothetical protein
MGQRSSTPSSAPSASPDLGDPTVMTTTRQRMHGIAECLMAGPQRRAGGRFTLRVTPDGFATTGGPPLRLEDTDLIAHESKRVALAGTFAQMADRLEVDFGPPPDSYPDGSGASPGDEVSLDAVSARLIERWYVLADAALRVLAPRQTPILWPEHFDVAILLESTTFGASPGDSFHAMPYAYVSDGDHGDSDFWNAPFGAFRSQEQMRSINDLVGFWRAAQALLKSHP